MALLTRSRNASETDPGLRSTRETVIGLTPARFGNVVQSYSAHQKIIQTQDQAKQIINRYSTIDSARLNKIDSAIICVNFCPVPQSDGMEPFRTKHAN